MRYSIEKSVLGLVLLVTTGMVQADELGAAIVELQHGWAKGYYSTPEIQREKFFDDLQSRAHALAEKFPGSADALIWEGIIASTHAQYQNFIAASGNAKLARDVLLKAEKIDPTAQHGSALTCLGTLYFKVPRFVSFGDHDKARSYLERALKVEPQGIDQNLYYAEFLAEGGEKAHAIEYLKRALNAPARPGREDADAGRRAEALQLLKKIGG